MPVWFPKNKEKPPPLCGAIEPHPSYIAKVCYVNILIMLNVNCYEIFFIIIEWWFGGSAS